jgi:hypothetical protein
MWEVPEQGSQFEDCSGKYKFLPKNNEKQKQKKMMGHGSYG